MAKSDRAPAQSRRGANYPQFDEEQKKKAEDAFYAAMHNADAFAQWSVDVKKEGDTRQRDLAKAVYKFIIEAIPIAVMDEMKMPPSKIRETMGKDRVSLPKFAQDFFKDHGLVVPHLNAVNPFATTFTWFWRKGQLNSGLIKTKKMDADLVKAAQNEDQMRSRYAKLILIAIDTGDEGVLDMTFREAEAKWKKQCDDDKPTIALLKRENFPKKPSRKTDDDGASLGTDEENAIIDGAEDEDDDESETDSPEVGEDDDDDVDDATGVHGPSTPTNVTPFPGKQGGLDVATFGPQVAILLNMDLPDVAKEHVKKLLEQLGFPA